MLQYTCLEISFIFIHDGSHMKKLSFDWNTKTTCLSEMKLLASQVTKYVFNCEVIIQVLEVAQFLGQNYIFELKTLVTAQRVL